MKFRLVREYAVNQDIFISPSIYSGLSSSIGCTVTAQFISLDPLESLGKVTAAAIKASVEANGGSARTQASARSQQDPVRVESQKGSAVSNTNPVQQVGIATATFGEIVALLSVLPVYKHMSLAELKWFR